MSGPWEKYQKHGPWENYGGGGTAVADDEIPPLPAPPATEGRNGLLQRAKDVLKETFSLSGVSDFLNPNAAERDAQQQSYRIAGPEAAKTSTLQKIGASFEEYGDDARKVAGKVSQGLMDWKSAVAFMASKIDPALTAAYFMTANTKGAAEATKDPKWYLSPDKMQNFLLSLAGIAGSGTGAESPKAGNAVEVAKSAGKAVKNAPAKAVDLVHKGAQIAAGVGPERTTGRLAEDYKADLETAQTKQAEENASTEAANRETIEKHATKRREAFRKNEEQNAELTLATEEIAERNRAALEMQSRRGVLARSLQQGSKDLGDQIQGLDKKVRSVGDAKYNAIRGKLESDPGVDPVELGSEMKAAVDKHIKGSAESMRQVQDVLRRGDSQSSVVINEREFTPQTDPQAWASFVEQGLVEGEAKPIKFGDLQGYSTELGDKLARGNLPGDVYQATKAVKEIIDREKMTIAERNGVADELKGADAFWRQYMDAFYDKPSAVAAVRERVGKLDPEHYSAPFISGKSAQTGIGKLEALAKSAPELATDLNTTAELAKSLRQQNEEFKGMPKTAKTQEFPEPPNPVEMPARPELKTPKKIKMPERPTVEDIRERKQTELHYAAREIGRLSKYDAAIIAASAIGPFFGRWESLLIDPAYIAGRKAIGYAIERPKVVEWLSRPRPEDLEILRKLPDEARKDIGNHVKQVADEERSHGRNVSVSPEVKSVFGWTGTGESDIESLRRGASGEPDDEDAENQVPFENRASSRMTAEKIVRQSVENFDELPKEAQDAMITQTARMLEQNPRTKMLNKGKKILGPD